MATDEMLESIIEEVMEEVQDMPSSDRLIVSKQLVAFALVALLLAAFLVKSRRQSDSVDAVANNENSPDGSAASPAA